MNGLRLPTKFLILGLLYVMAVIAVGFGLFLHLNRVVRASEHELIGIVQVTNIAKTMQLLQAHRGLSATLYGSETMRSAFVDNQAELQRSFATASQMVTAGSALHGEWLDIQADWVHLERDAQSEDASKNFFAHTRLIQKLQAIKRHIADQSTLSVDPYIDTHYLLETSIQTLPMALETIGQIRGLGAGILSKKDISNAQRLQMRVLMSDLQRVRQNLTSNIDDTVRYNPAVQHSLSLALKNLDSVLASLLDKIETDILAERFQESSADYFKRATAVMDQGYVQLFDILLPMAEQHIHARIEQAKLDMVLNASVALAILLAATWLFVGIYVSTINSVKTLVTAASDFAEGDFSKRVHLKVRDEIAEVGQSFNRMADGFNVMLDKLKDDEERLRAVVGSAMDAVIQMDSTGRIIGWSKHAETIFGWRSQDVLTRPLHEIIIPMRHRERHVSGMNRFLASGQAVILNTRVEIEGLHRNGSEMPIELAISSSQSSRGIEFCAYVRDITERKKTEANLRIAAIAFDAADGIVITDAQGIALSTNRAFTDITGYRGDEIIGKSAFVFKSDWNDAALVRQMWQSLQSDRYWQGEVWNKRKSREHYPQWIKVTAVPNDAGEVANYVMTFSDISQRKNSENTIQKLAFYDPLTELPNRRLLLDRVQHSMASSKRSHCYGALLLIDLDNFKTLNDTMGHDMGDQLLRQASARLSTCVRDSDTVARIGGDEFVVMLCDLDPAIDIAAEQAEGAGRKILSALAQIYDLGCGEYRSGASIGATLFRGNDNTYDDLFKQIDLALYRSKDDGRNRLTFFDPAMQRDALERVAQEAELRKAIESNALVLYYQPQIRNNRHVCGAEVLVRWCHPVHGLVPPIKFIPLAEESGLILPLGDWVLETACRQLARWSTQPALADLVLAVNVSAKQFHEADFVNKVLSIIQRTGARPNHLKLELTESVLVTDVDNVIAKMDALKALGVCFSLDDFGTGYSSLAYLKRLPLDQLKIDASFVRNILVDVKEASIAKTIVALAHGMGLEVIAEGVETAGQRDFLATIDCHDYQGYFYSKPVPVLDFEQFFMSTCAQELCD
jgi:diguanylate cyclase (GGDEF)-like protein/PAS domain S-box-containing protein